VLSEALPLNLVEGLVSSIEVEAGFTDGNHSGLAGETSNRLERRVELTTSMKLRRFVGVQGHSSEHSGLAGRERHGPLRGLNIGAHLEDTRDAHRLCPIEMLPVVHRVFPISKLEVRVIVIHSHVQGFWFRWVGQGSITSFQITALPDVGGKSFLALHRRLLLLLNPGEQWLQFAKV
jgi:hypothetical protein